MANLFPSLVRSAIYYRTLAGHDFDQLLANTFGETIRIARYAARVDTQYAIQP